MTVDAEQPGDSGPGDSSPGDSGLRFDRLPEDVRRWQRFGGAEAAALAEAEALRREIDRVAARLARWVAARRSATTFSTGDDPHAQRAWTNLRIAGLAMVAEVERQRSNNCNPSAGNAVCADDRAGENPAAADRACG
ncbi:hypothetical protein [Dongia sp.]|uniref:hypothetical protein n=1 Tax=Dongia sp. TaxID=1977262 RepID=UPI0035ADE520